jgi:hypothetical protein
VDAPGRFEVQGSRACYRPAASVALGEAVELIDRAIAFARDQGLDESLVDITGLTGFDPPTLAERYSLIQQWAETAAGRLRLAMVARPEMVDPQKFGVTVAANRGLVADVFTSEPEAEAWLDARR